MSKDGVYLVKQFDANTAKWRWNVHNYSTRGQKLYSDDFEVGGYKWRILLFPRGNNVQAIGTYLDVADAKQMQGNWTRYARFQLSIINIKNSADSVTQGTFLFAV